MLKPLGTNCHCNDLDVAQRVGDIANIYIFDNNMMNMYEFVFGKLIAINI